MPALPGGLPYHFRNCASRPSIPVQSMRGPIGEMMARRSAMSSAFSNGGFAYEDDILEDAIFECFAALRGPADRVRLHPFGDGRERQEAEWAEDARDGLCARYDGFDGRIDRRREATHLGNCK